MLENSAVCKWCKKQKPIDDFSFENKSQNRRKHYCKECNQKRLQQYYYAKRTELLEKKKQAYVTDRSKYLAKSRQYRANNPDKIKEAMSRWISDNPDSVKKNNQKRKAIIRGAKAKYISTKEVQRLLSQPCFYCGSKSEIQIDHIVPIARGGLHSIGNLLPACRACNSSKNKWFLTEWKKLKKGQMSWF